LLINHVGVLFISSDGGSGSITEEEKEMLFQLEDNFADCGLIGGNNWDELPPMENMAMNIIKLV